MSFIYCSHCGKKQADKTKIHGKTYHAKKPYNEFWLLCKVCACWTGWFEKVEGEGAKSK